MLTSRNTTTCPNRWIIVRTIKVPFKSAVTRFSFLHCSHCATSSLSEYDRFMHDILLDAVPLTSLSDYNRWSSMVGNKINMLVHSKSQIHVLDNEIILLVWSRALLPLNKQRKPRLRQIPLQVLQVLHPPTSLKVLLVLLPLSPLNKQWPPLSWIISSPCQHAGFLSLL